MKLQLMLTTFLFTSLALAQEPAKPQQLPWLETLADGQSQAQKRREPILVRAGGESCPWCKKLDGEVVKKPVQEALIGWTLVYVDADKSSKDTRTLAIDAIPALRILTSTGQVVATRDGYLPAEKLIAWLSEHREAASAQPLAELNDKDPLTAAGASKLAQQLRRRDPTLREAVVRRLLPHPELAAGPTVEAFADGNLQLRLALLELLQAWKAPVTGLDPWRPESVTEPKLKPLHDWAANVDPAKAKPAEELSADLRKVARLDVARMIGSTDAEAAAIRERLARHGKTLLPEVYESLKQAATDQARERLTALRYRLVCSEALALRWPIGIEQLAATATPVRHLAVEELAKRATKDDEGLLLELFSDTDPQVREISLRALHELGGSIGPDALIRLLADPEPNVRAAVLKQLVERPSAAVVPKIAEYAQNEKDVDLVVHAARVLRQNKTKAAREALQKLLTHASWRVRAEAVEAIGESIERHGLDRPEKVEEQAEVYAILLDMLKDADGFVVSRAVTSLKYVDLVVAVEPLVDVVEKHPQLAATAIQALARGGTMRDKALPHLRKFCGHANPDVRAAAIAGLLSTGSDDVGKELRAALADKESKVRRAAADAVFTSRMIAPARQDVKNLGGIHLPAPPGQPPVATATTDAEEPEKPDPDVDVTKARAKLLKADWSKDLVALLMPLLKAAAQDERLAAARPLIPLGHEAEAIPALIEAVRSEPALHGRAAQVFGWLPWKDRQDLYQKLVAIKPAPDQFADLINALVQSNDGRALPLLWEATTADQVAHEPASALFNGFNQLYLAEWRYPSADAPIPAKVRKRMVEEAQPKAEKGPVWQRLMALALLLSASPEDAGKIAQQILDDKNASPEFRRDAFQIMLISQSKAERRKSALAALARPEKDIRQLAMKFLVLGGDVLHYLRGDLPINPEADEMFGRGRQSTTNQPAKLDPPKGVTPELLQPLLKDDDPQIVACAGYLLALLGQPEGLEPLRRYWLEHRADVTWQRLLYRGIAALGDDPNVRLLEDVYRLLPRADTQRVSEFYWTIRSMEGPAALRLRKLMRQEIGMENLRAGASMVGD